MRRTALFAALPSLLLPLLACEQAPPDDALDGIDMLPPGVLAQDITIAGRWMPPADVLAIGDLQDVGGYDPSGPWNDGAGCAPWMLPGTVQLRDALYGYFPQIDHIGGYNCRPVVGSSNTLSQHGTGRALDIMIPTIGGDADNTAGDEIAHWLIENAEAMGIQAIIWDSTIWKVNRDPRAYAYTGAHPHRDHLHVELTLEAGNQETSWYSDPFGPGPCGSVPVAETILDETHSCFGVFGPSQYWRSEGGVGLDGDLLWTNAFENDTPSNWARWSLPFESAGEYELEVYIDPAFGVWNATRYTVFASDGEHDVIVDQSAQNGWTSLGVFDFDADGSEAVEVYDNYAGAVGSDQHVVVDALRVAPYVEPAPEPPPSSPPPEPEPTEPEPTEPEPTEPEPTEPAPTEPEPEDENTDVGTRPLLPGKHLPGQRVGANAAPLNGTPTVQSAGCSQSGAEASAPLWLLGLVVVAVRRRRHR